MLFVNCYFIGKFTRKWDHQGRSVRVCNPA